MLQYKYIHHFQLFLENQNDLNFDPINNFTHSVYHAVAPV
jgi:hypothetical protein